jgi:hypothetical protein
LPVRWLPQQSGDVRIVVQGQVGNDPDAVYFSARCIVPATDGEFAIPSSLLTELSGMSHQGLAVHSQSMQVVHAGRFDIEVTALFTSFVAPISVR